MHFPVGERGLVLGFVLPSFHVVICGAFFGFLKFFGDISDVYAISDEKDFFCVISGVDSKFK